MQVNVNTDQIKPLKKKTQQLYFEIHYEVAEEAAPAPSCRQHIIKPCPKTQQVNKAASQAPQTGADSCPAAEQRRSALSPCPELVADRQQRQQESASLLVLCLEKCAGVMSTRELQIRVRHHLHGEGFTHTTPAM